MRELTKSISQFKKRLLHKLLVQVKSEFVTGRQTKIFISAHGRGGSTWFANLLLGYPNSICLYEPLSGAYHYKCNDFPFGKYGSVEQAMSSECLRKYFESLFRFRNIPYEMVNNEIVKTSGIDILRAEVFIYKFIRANMILNWLNLEHAYVKTICLLRHPLATISSQIKYANKHKVGPEWDSNPYLDKSYFHESFYNSYRDIIDKVNTRAKKLAFWWAINTRFQLDNPNSLIVHYEDIFARPELELKKIYEYCGLDLRFLKDSVNRVNLLTGTNIDGQLDELKWKSTLSLMEIDEIKEVLTHFQLTNLYRL